MKDNWIESDLVTELLIIAQDVPYDLVGGFNARPNTYLDIATSQLTSHPKQYVVCLDGEESCMAGYLGNKYPFLV